MSCQRPTSFTTARSKWWEAGRKTSISTTTNASNVEIKLERKTLADTTYTQFGDFSNKNQITSVVSVIGDQSGLRKDIKVQFTKP